LESRQRQLVLRVGWCPLEPHKLRRLGAIPRPATGSEKTLPDP